MDGRVVKEGTVRRASCSVVAQTFCVTNAFDEGPSAIPSSGRGEGSRGNRAADVESRS